MNDCPTMQKFNVLGLEHENSGVCYGAGLWSPLRPEHTFSTHSPANGESIAHISAATADDYEPLLSAAIDAGKQWCEIPAPQRGEVIRRIGERLREHKSLLGDLIALEMGKIKSEADGEVQEMIDMADFAVGQSRMLYGLTMHSERPRHRMYEQWHPLGVTAVITAFNFPVAVWAWNAFIAAICGNTVIWKPSSQTPLCAIAVQHLCNDVTEEMGYPGIFSLFISHDRSLSERLVKDKRIPLVSFTGSCDAGAHVNGLVAERMGRTLLELGGNNALIVDRSAKLDLALPAIVFGAVGTAGQRCTTTRRLLIHESLYDELNTRLAKIYQQIRIGAPLENETLMGPLISESAVNQFLNTMEVLQGQNANILHGGKRIASSGYFVEPTLVEAQPDWDIVKHETFAPILYTMPFASIEEAIEIQNNVPQGLSSALFTTDLQQAEHFLAAIGSDCGIANINIGTSGAEIGGAFGGEKMTGGGREAGSDAWKAYMRRQTNTINWSDDLPLAQGIQFNV